jgi:hypothetical protein
MSTFPKPPMGNRAIASNIPTPPGLGPLTYIPPPHIEPALPKIEDIETHNGKLTENEVSIILKTSLLPEHHRDPIVIRFIQSYMTCRDTSQASKECGIATGSGKALRNRPDIHEAITRLTEKSVMKYGFDASEVIEKVKEISAIDPIEFVRPDGTYKTDMNEIAPESRRAIKKFKAKNLYGEDNNGMKTVIGELIEVEFWDKMKAVELLGREKDLFKQTTTVQHDVTTNMANLLLESSQRAEHHAREVIDVTPVARIEAGKKDE